jgi:hypothetical protein
MFGSHTTAWTVLLALFVSGCPELNPSTTYLSSGAQGVQPGTGLEWLAESRGNLYISFYLQDVEGGFCDLGTKHTLP